MATFHGHIPEFTGNADEWRIYAERLVHYFNIDKEEKKRAILLSVCGTATLKLINSLLTPDDLATKSFAEIVKLVKEYHHPETSAIVMQFRLNSCVRNNGESVAAFAARLRELADIASFAEYTTTAYNAAFLPNRTSRTTRPSSWRRSMKQQKGMQRNYARLSLAHQYMQRLTPNLIVLLGPAIVAGVNTSKVTASTKVLTAMLVARKAT